MDAAHEIGWAALPRDLRAGVLGGLRWTVWLAAAGVPFSYGTRVLLARMGPEPLAIYGLLLVYVNFVAAFLFLGGNAVAIRFLPAIEVEARPAFLRTYFLVSLLGWLPWLAVAAWRPQWLHWLFGGVDGRGFAWAMMALAPIPILFSLLLAALKGELQLARAQWIYRNVTVGMFVVCALLFFRARAWTAAHAAVLLWGAYLALNLAGAAAAWRILNRNWTCARRQGWWLPRGFWKYTLALQGSSMLGFLATQLDMLIVLQAGGVAEFGRYVALLTLAAMAATAVKLLLDVLMASLTHAMARGDSRLAGELWTSHCRMLVPLVLVLNLALACWAVPLLSVYGGAYMQLQTALRWLGPLAAIACMNYLLGSSLAALGFPQLEMQAKAVRIISYLALFFPLWSRWGLSGAVLAWGGAEIPYQAVNLWNLGRRAPFHLNWTRTYAAFVGALAAAAAANFVWQPQSFLAGLMMLAALLSGFLLAAGYTARQLVGHLRVLTLGAEGSA